MKLIFYEIRKVFSLRIFTVCLAAFFIVNGIILWYVQEQDEKSRIIHQNRTQYETLIEKYSSLSESNAKAKLEYENTIGDIIRTAIEGSKNPDMPPEVIEMQLEDYRAANPEAYTEAMKSLSDGYDESYYNLLSIISAQLSYADTYKEFISGMRSRAENKLNFSAMSGEDSFSRKNILKTPDDFENVRGVKPSIGNYSCLENSTSFQLTDYLLIVLILLICIALFTVERDKKLNIIVRSTYNGLMPTILSKISAIVVLAFTVSVAFFALNIAVSGAYTGFGSLSESVQSSEIFMNCPFRFSVWQYLILWVLAKSAAMCSLSLIFTAVFVLVDINGVNYIICSAFAAVELVLYTFIEPTFFLNQLKYINIFSFLWDNNTLGSYLNINIFGEAVSLSVVFAVVTAVVVALFSGISIVCYVKNFSFTQSGFTGKLSEKTRQFLSLHFNTTSIFHVEMHKTVFRGAYVIMMLFLCIFAHSQYTQNIELRYFDAKKSCYAGYMLELNGEMTPEKEDYIKSEKKFFETIDTQIDDIRNDNALSETKKGRRISTLENIQSIRGEAFEEVFAQYKYSESSAKKLGIETYMLDRDVGNILVSAHSCDWRLFVIILAFIVVVIPHIFGYEYKNGSENLLRTCKKGRLNLISKKILTAYIISAVAYALVYLPFVLNFARVYGSDVFNIPLVFVENYSGVNSAVTITQYLILVSVARIAVLASAEMLALASSVWLKNTVTSMVFTTSVTLLPCVIFMNNSNVRFSALFASGNWVYAVPLLCVAAIIILAAGFIVIAYKFGNINIRKRGIEK